MKITFVEEIADHYHPATVAHLLGMPLEDVHAEIRAGTIPHKTVYGTPYVPAEYVNTKKESHS
ncbi:hypothetical protein [Trueperella bialowiezensis]|uniref:DNA-binding protein n=1 Tax=Trueperella bialowiezensis TaxID=312285 RepID=A0A448PE82_9ACTO|nr:hypothetical protein [Trueperella bialowiezensis]VEI13246.1 Uncharacterised protein [Trueperella bialowiezensis]